MIAKMGLRTALWCGVFLFLPLAWAARAELPADSLKTIRNLAIQHNGREKPFDSFAREILKQITGKPHFGRESAVETVISIMADAPRWKDYPLISVPFVPLRETLGLEQKATHVSHNYLTESRILMQVLPPIAHKQERDEKLTMLENETMDLYGRFAALSSLFDQDVHIVPPPSSVRDRWLSILEPEGYPREKQEALRGAWAEFIASSGEQDSAVISRASGKLDAQLRSANTLAYPAEWRLRLEVLYNRLTPFRVARFAYLFAAVGLLLSLIRRNRFLTQLGMTALWVGFIVHAAGIIVRMVLGGRPPVANFYESVLWLPLVGVLLALIFDRIYRMQYFGFAAALLAAGTLMLSENLPLDSSISPVIAVLRSNLWLTVHVLTIVGSYGALALAAVVAHIYGCLYLARQVKHPVLPSLGKFCYRAVQVGVVLLAVGIMLGAVWANVSWGRYWGWDPKETWSLITLLWFLAILHGRYAGWLKGVGVALSIIGGFFLLLMTYYGVSFYLVGLHSYAGGHAKTLPPLLIAYLLAEAVFITIIVIAGLSRRRAA